MWDTHPMKDETLVVGVVVIMFSCIWNLWISCWIFYSIADAVNAGAAKWTVDKYAHVQLEWIKQN